MSLRLGWWRLNRVRGQQVALRALGGRRQQRCCCCPLYCYSLPVLPPLGGLQTSMTQLCTRRLFKKGKECEQNKLTLRFFLLFINPIRQILKKFASLIWAGPFIEFWAEWSENGKRICYHLENPIEKYLIENCQTRKSVIKSHWPVPPIWILDSGITGNFISFQVRTVVVVGGWVMPSCTDPLFYWHTRLPPLSLPIQLYLEPFYLFILDFFFSFLFYGQPPPSQHSVDPVTATRWPAGGFAFVLGEKETRRIGRWGETVMNRRE